MDFGKLELLETKVAALIEKRAAAEKGLSAALKERDDLKARLEEAEGRLKEADDEKGQVLERLEALLEKLDL